MERYAIKTDDLITLNNYLSRGFEIAQYYGEFILVEKKKVENE